MPAFTWLLLSTTLRHWSANSRNMGSFIALSMSFAGEGEDTRLVIRERRWGFSRVTRRSGFSRKHWNVSGKTLSSVSSIPKSGIFVSNSCDSVAFIIVLSVLESFWWQSFSLWLLKQLTEQYFMTHFGHLYFDIYILAILILRRIFVNDLRYRLDIPDFSR